MSLSEQIKNFELRIPPLMQKSQIPGLAIAIVKDQQVIYSHGFGARDLKEKLPVNSDSLFGIGSVTKSFTCLAVMQLAEAGQLDLGDPVSKYIPFNLDRTDDPITIRHLMSHTSGIPNLGSAETVIARECLNAETYIPLSTTDDVLRFFNGASEEIRFAPGEHFFYYNGGYALLALIIEKTSGMEFEDYIQAKILTPLEMNRSTLKEEEFEQDPNKATAYLLKPQGKIEPTKHMFDKAAKGAGGLFSSVTELGNYLIMIMNGGIYKEKKVLDQKSIQDMYEIQKGTRQDHGMYGDFGYGYGWVIIENFLGHKLYGHGGSTLVSAAYIGFLPEMKLGIALVANNGNAPLGIFGQAMLAMMLGKTIEVDIPFFKVQKKFEKFVGQYTSYSKIYNPKITLKEGMLFYELKVVDFINQKVPLIPKNRTIDNNEFYIYNMGMIEPVKFIIRETGDVDLLIERNLFHKVRG
ncbi:MAG: serine hydrolase [Candidatus Hodarchaeota archaeon]